MIRHTKGERNGLRGLHRDDRHVGWPVARPRFVIARIFANAFARRLAAVIVAGVLAWMGIGGAHAQSTTQCLTLSYTSYHFCATRTEAELGTQGAVGAFFQQNGGMLSVGTYVYQDGGYINGVAVTRVSVFAKAKNGVSSSPGRTFPKALLCPSGQEWNDVRGGCQSPCSGRPQSLVKFQQMIPNGSYSCVDGCEARIAPAADGEYFQTFVGGTSSHCNALPSDCSKFGAGYGMNYGASMCQPPFVECKENEVKDPISGTCSQGCEPGKMMDASGVCKPAEDTCPPGDVKSPSGGCLPGEGKCAAGEARGKDGTCKRDADGDGKPDEGEEEGQTEETFSGGDTCNAPPACSGSPIMCGQARIQWRIDCNTRRNTNISGGACSAMPICTGDKCDATEYAQLIQQWKAACALEKLASKTGDDGDGSQPEWTKVGGMNQNPGAGEQSGDKPKLNEKKVSTDDLDQSGFGGGSCIGFAAGGGQGVSAGFLQTLASPPPLWCNFILALKGVFILIGAVVSVFIISRGA